MLSQRVVLYFRLLNSWAVFVAQLAERSLPASDTRGRYFKPNKVDKRERVEGHVKGVEGQIII